MPKWLRKSIVVMVTILTFGMVTPSQDFLHENQQSDKSPKKAIFADHQSENEIEEVEPYISKEAFISQMVKSAEQHSFDKFGIKIKPVIEEEFSEVILPNIEKAIEEVAVQYPQERLVNLKISETATAGISERIFHIADETKNQDVIRFHVRRDNPPQQGHWFNFHYHTYYDQFQEHHNLGSIYWDKNTPPKWMS
ncbi:YpjP family protein [Cytobacillus horneckiae]|uniref:YpjP family protein n=1 Tax=Cytobacillus horneckiae TaxID=549687 RepID=UPI00203FE0CA|nr:YpjP family protein [Cytobacillus horneckiae]MCM3180348.1 YpjP family protein [Cytobacillus horneckiae]